MFWIITEQYNFLITMCQHSNMENLVSVGMPSEVSKMRFEVGRVKKWSIQKWKLEQKTPRACLAACRLLLLLRPPQKERRAAGPLLCARWKFKKSLCGVRAPLSPVLHPTPRPAARWEHCPRVMRPAAGGQPAAAGGPDLSFETRWNRRR